MKHQIPETQHAVQLTGPDQLILNAAKPVHLPGPHQILCLIEAVGLCFSDLKLLKQFSDHARKTPIKSGIDPDILDEIPSYVPAGAPAVPGHEAVIRISAVGAGVTAFKPGERYLVQTDYRWLPTAESNASFGYNFEGGLQQYVSMDERIITSPRGQSMLIPVSENLSASAVALVEPWACVENAYTARDRRTLKTGGGLLIVSDRPLKKNILTSLFSRYGKPARITLLSQSTPPEIQNIPFEKTQSMSELEDASFDDIIYLGSCSETVEELFPKIAVHGLLNIALCGGRFGRLVTSAVGRVHYGGIRIIGTTGSDPAESMEYIPESGEIRNGGKINVIGAAGPMGMMHVIRNLCQGVDDISIFAGDLDRDRLGLLSRIAVPIAEKHKISFNPYNPGENPPQETFDYVILMAPIPALVSQSVQSASRRAIINIFAGIPAHVSANIDMDAYIEKQLYFIGTSGSVLEDMQTVLAKVESGAFDTNLSVAAVSGLEGAIEGIRAIENHLIPGKIIVYPSCEGLGLISLDEMREKLPEMTARLTDGLWNAEAEKKLLEMY